MTKRTEHTKRSKRKAGHPALQVIGTIFLIALVTGAMLACMAVMYVKIVIMPDVKLELTDFTLNLTTSVYYIDEDGNEQVLQQLHGSENRIWIKYEDIPENLVNAAIAIEDKRFYKHDGVDWIRTVKGIINMFTGQDIQGGSTLTQQLIKNLTTEDQVTVKRKVNEIFRALEFEKNYSKEKILEWYLNYIFLGEGCNGVYTASYAYFGKNVSELTLAECASLIGITNNPSKFNPYLNTVAKTEGQKTNLQRNKERQENILWQMYDQGYITEAEYNEAVAQELVFVRGVDETRQTTVYSYFVDAVIDQVIADLMQTRNCSETVAADMVYSGGLKIYTSYKPGVQAAVDAVYEDRGNLNYYSSTGQALQSAITIVDNETGNVVALAGGVGEKTGSRTLNRATTSKRPPGSAIKPLSVYAPALEMGLITPFTVVNDSPFKDGWPVNSYGSYRGLMTITEALRVSANTVAVKVLDMVTPEYSYQFMQDRFHIKLVESMSIGNEIYSDINYASLGLGGLTEGVSTYEMAAAFSTFARSGVYYEPSTYTKVLDSEGNEILSRNNEGEVALKEKTTYYINRMLEGVVASGTGRGANFRGQDISGKTGTTSSRKDLWFVGYTPYYTAAVWTGYDQQERLANGLGNPSVTLWKQVMQRVHAYTPYKTFPAPDSESLVWVSYCTTSGKVANSYCPSVGSMQIFKEDVPGHCTTHTKSIVTPPPVFDINDESTWPTDDANFNPNDPSTWPTGNGGGESDGGGGGGAPETQVPSTPDPAPEPPVEVAPPADDAGEDG